MENGGLGWFGEGWLVRLSSSFGSLLFVRCPSRVKTWSPNFLRLRRRSYSVFRSILSPSLPLSFFFVLFFLDSPSAFLFLFLGSFIHDRSTFCFSPTHFTPSLDSLPLFLRLTFLCDTFSN